MKRFDSIPLHPLRMRGLFGVSSYIFRQGFFAAFFYTLFYKLLCWLLYGLALFPALLRLHRSGAVYSFINNLYYSIHHQSFSLDLSALTGVAGLIALTLLMVLLAFLLIHLLLRPTYESVMHTEMSTRVYGRASSLSAMLRHSGESLRQHYSTYIAFLLSKLGMALLCSACLGVLIPVLWVVLLSLLLGDFPFAPLLLLLILAGFAWAFIVLAAQVLVSLSFPAAVNEPEKRGFGAVGRSFSLAGSRFFPALFANLLLWVFMWLFTLPFSAANLILYAAEADKALRICILAGLLCGVILSLCREVYARALYTVIYFDARLRKEGEAFLHNKGNIPPEADDPIQDAEAPKENTQQGEDYGTEDTPRDES